MTVDPEVERVILEFHQAGQPLALCCIAPILAAKVLGKVIEPLILYENFIFGSASTKITLCFVFDGKR